MPPTLYIVRHAEGENNIEDSHFIRDAVLTDKGKAQCSQLREEFPYHYSISIVMSSPLRRAIQTAAFSFGPTLRRPDVQYLAVPLGQEVSDKQCDIGHSRAEIEQQLPELLKGQEIGFDPAKFDFSLVEDGWNSKAGRYAPDHEAVKRRAADLRSWLYQRSEPHILLVTHGAFLHFLTEDWTGDDPKRGTAYLNCEVRIFNFTENSTSEDTHLEEREESKKSRVRLTESHPSILAEMAAVGTN
ncbi:hypothetical protein Egran_06101 [Elaphomyces granulatus]|uniref:Phosphoglycerate mutase-like protein n=1 Tax=Elaphomyces granulatus TaxID=519963 RepID=A0A232LPP4_9EURO|nr:hypothetical protein Egran_06101 [Elaphomyces granulatus]